ncbi:uncharacterized protein LOC123941585 [Meles meles]|uniref:uncharacterized protein LOC123941585 n=1 Tax=Meles meles TaxID=9662 RepID=UPI001E69FF4D|nr:uncharacterized protein LOC123941585 [Meles meles]
MVKGPLLTGKLAQVQSLVRRQQAAPGPAGGAGAGHTLARISASSPATRPRLQITVARPRRAANLVGSRPRCPRLSVRGNALPTSVSPSGKGRKEEGGLCQALNESRCKTSPLVETGSRCTARVVTAACATSRRRRKLQSPETPVLKPRPPPPSAHGGGFGGNIVEQQPTMKVTGRRKVMAGGAVGTRGCRGRANTPHSGHVYVSAHLPSQRARRGLPGWEPWAPFPDAARTELVRNQLFSRA